MSMATANDVERARRDGELFGIPLGDLGWFQSLIMGVATGMAAFFLTTFLAILALAGLHDGDGQAPGLRRDVPRGGISGGRGGDGVRAGVPWRAVGATHEAQDEQDVGPAAFGQLTAKFSARSCARARILTPSSFPPFCIPLRSFSHGEVRLYLPASEHDCGSVDGRDRFDGFVRRQRAGQEEARGGQAGSVVLRAAACD